MALLVNKSGAWRNSNMFIKLSGVWHEVKNVYDKISGVWHPIWTYSWEVGAFGACSTSCGGGTQTRTVTCKRSDGLTKADNFCWDVGTKPATSQVCNTQSCVVISGSGVDSSCGFDCGTTVMTGATTINIDYTNGVYNYIGTFNMSPSNGRDIVWRFPFSVYDVAIWVKLAISSSIRGVTDVPMLCGWYGPTIWSPPRLTNMSSYYCDLSFPNEQRKASIWFLARIPNSYIGPEGNINTYIYTGERRNYSGNMMYFHNNMYFTSSYPYSRACYM